MRLRPTDQEVQDFARDGVVCLRDFMALDFIHLLEQGFERNIKSPGPYACFYTKKDSAGLFRDDYCNWQRIDEYRRVIFESNLAETAAILLQANEIRFFHEHIFFKKEGTIKKTPWHHDLPYYCVDGDQGLSFWVPLSPIDESNKIEFIAGSHAWGKLFRPNKFSGEEEYNVPKDLYEELPDFDSPNNSYKKLSWTMNVGDVLAFDFRCVHGNTENAKPNLVDRRSIAFRFLGENMRFSTRPGEKSPPFPNINLKPGDPMNHELFPILWKACQI